MLFERIIDVSGNMNQTKRKLFEKLKEFHPDRDFVGGVMSNTNNDSDRQKIIDYIEKGNDVTVENIILLSLHLNNETNKK